MPPWTPEAPRYRFEVLEEQPLGTILTTMQATDADSTVAEYRMTDNSYFEINNTTGKNLRSQCGHLCFRWIRSPTDGTLMVVKVLV